MPKEFLTYRQQMEKLRSSGLTIEDEGACCGVLADIGYFPVVNGYQSFFRDPSTRVYREGATFGTSWRFTSLTSSPGSNTRCATQGRGEDRVGGGLRVLRCIWRVPGQVPRKSLIYFDYVY